MISKKKYLLQAYYEWIRDSELTPYLLVNAEYPQVHVPAQYVRDGQIVLDISSVACRELSIEHEAVKFSARFAGQLWQICLPLASILAIYAKENSQGMTFKPEDEVAPTTKPLASAKDASTSVKKPFLTVISNDEPNRN
jgi:stringent starvation protein B